MKFILLFSIAIFLIQIAYSQETINLSGTSGTWSTGELSGSEIYDIYINTGASENLIINIDYDIDTYDAEVILFEYPSEDYINSFSGLGTYSYQTSNSSGQAYIQLFNDEYSWCDGSVTIAWQVMSTGEKNSFPDFGSTILQTLTSNSSNLKILDKNGKSVPTAGTSLSEKNSLLSLENSNGNQMEINPNRIISNTNLGLVSKSSLFLSSAYTQYFLSYGSFTMTLNNEKVGIGTTSPSTNLHVAGDGETIGQSSIANANLLIGSTSNGIGFDDNEIYKIGSELYFGTGDTNPIRLRTNKTDVMFLSSDGEVGIGNIAPEEKLHISGNVKVEDTLSVDAIIYANEIEVKDMSASNLNLDNSLFADKITIRTNGNTADFVFSEDYKLRDLSELENFIKAYNHLPEIPSAADMEDQGINLAEMNKLLLQKVEELTLYTIDLEKKLKNKEQTEKLLEERISNLEKLLSKIIEL